MLKHISIITQIVKIGNMGEGVDWFIDYGEIILLVLVCCRDSLVWAAVIMPEA